MKRTVLTFGLLSGAVVAGLTAVLLPLCMARDVDLRYAEVIGYSAMVMAFLFVFFGVRSYRDREGGGTIGFGRAFLVGTLIVLVASAVYVTAWEIVYYGFLPDFGEVYAEHAVSRLESAGASAEEVAARRAEMASFAEKYRNPLFNVAVTFLEVFPVGLVVALVSAGILRRKRPAPGGAAAVAA